MPPSKRLNLSAARDDDESSSASSSSDSEAPARSSPRRADADEDSQTEDESDEEFEIPPGFESVSGHGGLTRESVLSGDKELWFFKLPKNLDASALDGVKFKVGSEQAGASIARVKVGEDKKPYVLQREHDMLAGQLVNALPMANDRKRFALAKPFSRCFSLVEDHETASVSRPASTSTEEPVKKKKKSKHTEEEEEKPKKSKKSKKSKHGEHGDAPRTKKLKA